MLIMAIVATSFGRALIMIFAFIIETCLCLPGLLMIRSGNKKDKKLKDSEKAERTAFEFNTYVEDHPSNDISIVNNKTLKQNKKPAKEKKLKKNQQNDVDFKL
jgi:ABC-type transport system involved in cytochrome bd biosynthesis fused ATPase/permease subunit